MAVRVVVRVDEEVEGAPREPDEGEGDQAAGRVLSDVAVALGVGGGAGQDVAEV